MSCRLCGALLGARIAHGWTFRVMGPRLFKMAVHELASAEQIEQALTELARKQIVLDCRHAVN